MKWLKNFYVGESLKGSRRELMDEAAERSFFTPWFLITLPVNPGHLLDIRSTKTIYPGCVQGDPPMVVGLAGSEQEAVCLVQQIIQACLDRTGGLDLNKFLIEE